MSAVRIRQDKDGSWSVQKKEMIRIGRMDWVIVEKGLTKKQAEDAIQEIKDLEV